ncbi:MAG: accessory gene regulator ArgB-like protein [Oscillospiraceae bacterium]
MIAALAAKITSKQIAAGRVSQDQAAVYQYGYEIVINYILNFLVILLVGLLFGRLLAVAMFCLAYMPLRSFAGGHHASTHERCTVVSALILVLFCIIMHFIPSALYLPATTVNLLLSAPVILYFSPVEDVNKPLFQQERKLFGKRARIMWATELLCVIILLFFHLWQFAYIVSLGHLTLAIIMILGLLLGRRKKASVIDETENPD